MQRYLRTGKERKALAILRHQSGIAEIVVQLGGSVWFQPPVHDFVIGQETRYLSFITLVYPVLAAILFF